MFVFASARVPACVESSSRVKESLENSEKTVVWNTIISEKRSQQQTLRVAAGPCSDASVSEYLLRGAICWNIREWSGTSLTVSVGGVTIRLLRTTSRKL